MDAIPHRSPIRCVDTIVRRDETSATCAYEVREGPHTDGGVMWAMSLVEGMAQAAAAIETGTPEAGRRTRSLAVLSDLTVSRRPHLGETVRFHARVTRAIPRMTVVLGHARVGDEVVARAQLKLVG